MIITREELQERLEEAGAILLSMPGSAGPARFKSNLPQPIQDACEAYGYGDVRLRVQRPSGPQITRMDEALAWVSLIPADGVSADPASLRGGATLRRIVQARLLIDPVRWYRTPGEPKYLFSWRMLSSSMGADVRALKVWHGAALGLIVDALAKQKVAA
jgi:hypothetical protein